MAPGAGKRKRPQDEVQTRPSPHRPESLNLAQQNQRYDRQRGGGGGGSGGGSGGGGGGRNNNRSQNSTPTHNRHNNHHQSQQSPQQPSPSQQRRHPSPSRHSTPATPVPTPAAAPSPAPRQTPAQPSPAPPPRLPTPKEPPAPYAYDYLTDEALASWQSTGQQSVLDALSKADDKETTGSLVIQELLRAALDGRLKSEDAAALLKLVAPDESMQSVFADTLALLDDSDWKSPVLRWLISQAGLSPHLLRHELDIEPLSALGLVRNTFSTIRNRKTTNLIYRQANFNLLREETEGYSKLITEYFNAANAGSTSDLIAEDTFQRIKALVGSFDLDVGRVLDITLDVMANLLIKNFRFFVKYLRASSWWPEQNTPEGLQFRSQGFASLPAWALPGSASWGPTPDQRAELVALKHTRDVDFWENVRKVGMDAFFEIGALRITNADSPAVSDLLNTEIQPELDSRGREMNKVRRLRTNNARKWMRETGCLVPPGNSDAAQLLGFKLAFYASEARSKNDVLPDNLIYLAAFLIKIGFISLRDLYPHLYPPDEKMSLTKERLEKEKVEREKAARPGGGALNALAMAGALADDTLPVPAIRALRDTASGRPSPKPESEASAVEDGEKEALPEPADQKIALVKSLLAIGCIPEALYILGKFPWLADLVPELPDYIHRILHHMLSKVYEPARPLASRTGLSSARDHIGDPAGLPKGQLKFVPAPPLKTLRWANLDRPDHGDAVEYKFYWDDWADNVPVCQSVDDVFLLCSTFLNLTGVKIGRDSALLMKLARIGKKSLTDDPSESNTARWIDLCKRLLVPALSLTKHNTGDVNEMFELLKFFPTNIRYAIYAEWHYGPTSRLPDIKSAFDLTKAETKDVLKRISKTNVRAMGKALSKVAFSSPGVVMQVAIHQMESYDNLIDVVVECVRYFSMLGYDVLTWCLMNALGGGGRNRVQADGMLTSPWLRALSTFAGSIFKRYSAMDPSPILQYVTNELRTGNSTDLEVLEQIITEMAGIKSDIAFNDSQVLAMAGGPVLKAQTLISLLDERHKMEKPSRRLVKALVDPGLAGPLLIAVAQERQMYAHHESTSEAPLKVLGNNLDKLHQVFNQYLDTLRSNLAPKDFDAAVPDIVSLMAEYGLEPAIAFMIGRTSIAHAIAESDAARKAEQQQARRSSQAAANGDVSMADADEKEEKSEEPSPSEEKPILSLSETDAEMKQVMQANGVDAPTPSPPSDSFWHPALTPVIEKTRELLGGQLEATISIPFYVTFWTLGLEDILVNTNSYDQELANQAHLINQISNDRTDVSVKGTQEKEKRKKAISELREKLTQEMKTQIGAYTQVRNRLNKEKDHWFPDFYNKIELLHQSILQNCFLPRIFNSSLDAHYTFMMLKFLHNNGAPGFRTMHLLDLLLRKNQLAALMFQCTPRESENFGRFLNEVLKELMLWHGDRTTYEKNAYGQKRQLPGFARRMNADHTPQTLLDFEDYRRLLYKWNVNLNGALKLCFESGEYMHIRNAIIVLKAVYQHFPAVTFMGDDMIKMVTKLSKEESRDDLKLAAASLLGDIKRREKHWVMPQAFRVVSVNVQLIKRKSDEFKNDAVPNPKSNPSRSGTPASRTVTPLNGAAPEFKPPSAVANGESEDGEIDDDKLASKHEDHERRTVKEETPAESKNLSKPDPHSRAPTPSQANGSRSASTQPPARLPHSLPSKPERLPPRQVSSRGPAPARHDSRERGSGSEFGRLDRPEGAPRSTPNSVRELSPVPGRRGRQRSPEYPPREERRDYSSRQPLPPQEMRMQEREAPYGPARPHPSRDSRGYSNGPTPMLPPHQPDRSGYDRHERGQPPMSRTPAHNQPPLSQEPAVGAHPSRLALINGEVPRDDRRSRDHSRDDRRGSRPQSPRDPMDISEPTRREEPRRAPLDPNPFQSQRVGPPSRESPAPPVKRDDPPTGPRVRSGREPLSKPTRGDLFHQEPRPVDRSAQDPNYGRLASNPDAPSGPPPSGPRGFGGNARNNAPTQPAANARSNDVPVSAPHSPTGGRRRPQEPQSAQFSRSTAQQPSAPSTPAAQPEVAGVHPSRMGRLSDAPLSLPAPPSGPRSSIGAGPQTPTGPSGGRVPAGPANDRRGGSDRRFAGLNETLQGSGERGTSIRGRGAKTAMAPPVSSPAIQVQQPSSSPALRGEPFQQPQQQQQQPRAEAGPRRHDDRSDRHRSGSERSHRDDRHGQPPPPPPPPADDFRNQSSRDSRSSRPRNDRDSYGRNAVPPQPMLSSAAQPPPSFPAPPTDPGYAGGRAPRFEGDERGGDYRRDGRDRGDRGRDDGRSRGGDRKRRGEEMSHDGSKRRRSGM